MAKKKKKEIGRVPMGIQIFGGGRSPMLAYQTYRINYDDGTEVIDRGRTVRCMPNIDDVNRKRGFDLSYRPDLGHIMAAAAILNQAISDACFAVDAPPEKK